MRKNQNDPVTNCSNDKKNNDMVNSDSELDKLVLWNVSKALEKNPQLDLMKSLTTAQKHLHQESNDPLCNHAEGGQHFICALLAWQQMGHNNPGSLYEFVQTKMKEEQCTCSAFGTNPKTTDEPKFSMQYNKAQEEYSGFTSCSRENGPVVKLPIDTKVIMRIDQPVRKTTSNKINTACNCMDEKCKKNLTALGQATEELRKRATSLAKREAERVELLERAEAAWGDLERGFQRRLKLIEEKTEDFVKQIEKAAEERDKYREDCNQLSQELVKKSEVAEKLRASLRESQKVMCERACIRLKLNDEALRGETLVAEEQCKAVQLERDLQFKEEHARRKLLLIEDETQSASALLHDSERAMRAELSGLRDQVKQVSNQLLEEDAYNTKIREQLNELRTEKQGLIDDLEGCKEVCDKKMQGLVDAAKKKREELAALKEKVLECRCKLPVDVAVEVKRTPSLAAICKCEPEDRLLESCSCTSMRRTLISNLLSDLFRGLQSELNVSGVQMHCELMKCLDDKHNWDRASLVKTNLQNFFSQLLLGELDIAIASSIEKYHAKWVGTSCADGPKLCRRHDNNENEWVGSCALERRAKKLAAELAEQLFQERAAELTKRAKEIVTSGPPPCDCNKSVKQNVMPCLVSPFSPFKPASGIGHGYSRDFTDVSASNWKRTNHDVSELKQEIKTLKKESIKKQDLKTMELNIAKIIKQAATNNEVDVIDMLEMGNKSKDNQNISLRTRKKETKYLKSPNAHDTMKLFPVNKNEKFKKANLEPTHEKPLKQHKKYVFSKNYAVNVCLCGKQKPSNKDMPSTQINMDTKSSTKLNSSKRLTCQDDGEKSVKTNSKLAELNRDGMNDCLSDCKCLFNPPSNKSINKLFGKLVKWKTYLEDPNKLNSHCSECNLNGKCFLNKLSQSFLNTILDSDPKQKPNVKDKFENHNKINKILRENKQSLTNVSKCVPYNTGSEYMAQINLDESNEFRTKFVDEMKTNASTKQPEFKEDILNQCLFKNIEIKKQGEDKNKNKKHSLDLKHLINSTLTEKERVSETDYTENDVNQRKISPNNFDYCVKFLGVTLSDVDSDRVPDVNDQNKRVFSRNNDVDRLTPLRHDEPQRDKQKHNTKYKIVKQKGEKNKKNEDFQDFIMKMYNDQLKTKTFQQKDVALDSQSFLTTNKSLNNCVCCNSLKEGAKELEVNAFDLLEEHLKGKLNEFKNSTCKSSCIPTEQADKIFSTILKKVKQVISDCANEAKDIKAAALTNDGSWRRVYGLLQEYLKVKMKRVQRLPLFSEQKDGVLPAILEKVSTLIEHDFQRLKEICKCNDGGSVLTNTSLKNTFCINEKPEKDTNTIKNYSNAIKSETCDVGNIQNCLSSRRNSVKSTAVTKNLSSQIPLSMVNKSCNVIHIDEKSKSGQFIYNTCNCRDNEQYPGCHANVLKNSKHIMLDKNVEQNVALKQSYYYNVLISKSLPNFRSMNNIITKVNVNKQETNQIELANIPLVGCTVDCSCNGNLQSCVCTKSTLQDCHRITNNWKQLIEKNKKCCKDLSYIMHGTQKNININTSNTKQDNSNKTCATETNIDNKVALVLSNKNISTNHYQTFDRSSEINSQYLTQYKSLQSEIKPSVHKLVRSVCENRNIIETLKCSKSDTTTHIYNCHCSKVPICHIKMLVDNIEQNIMNSRCTCDIMSTVCPVHFS